MPRHAGLLGFFIYDFPEESHKAVFASGEEKIMTCFIYSTLHWSYSDQMESFKNELY